MCLDQGSFVLIHNDQEISLDDVACLLPGPAELKLVDVYGKTRRLSGTVEEIDLLNRRIVLG